MAGKKRKSSETVALSDDEKVVQEAKERFNRCEQWEANARIRYLDDYKFSEGDSDNGYQWPNNIRDNRDTNDRPCLTINKVRQHCLQILNDAKQNKPAISYIPSGDGATLEAAKAFEGLVRRIEYISSASEVYEWAMNTQVRAGMGCWRVITEYADDESFDQEIYIRRIKDPLSVYIDPDCLEIDKSDARFAFVFDDVPKKEFERLYPEYAGEVGNAALGNTDTWLAKDHVRVAEYYRQIEEKDTLIAIKNSDGEETMVLKSSIPAEIWAQYSKEEYKALRKREVARKKIQWYKIAGNKVIEEREWPGKYIPVVMIVGEEYLIDGSIDRKGHVRAMKDPQRIYNYWSSSAVESVCLQNKIPYITPSRAVAGLESYWKDANRVNLAFLPYNDIDEDGNPIPRPTREMPPQMAQAYIQGMQVSANDMAMVSGQFAPMFGEGGNERTGRAITGRQRQGENATYHYSNNLAVGVKFTGKILLDLIPKIYDTARVVKIMGPDGTQQEIEIDPQQAIAYQAQQMKLARQVSAVFNPKVGKYDVFAQVGPAYATKRQEAFDAFSLIVTQNPQLVEVAGDLLFKNADFPGADEIAERLARLVPPQAKGEGPPPEVMQLQQQLQTATSLVDVLTQQLGEERLKTRNQEKKTEVDEYRAISDRLKVVLPEVRINEQQMQQMMRMLQMQNLRVTQDLQETDSINNIGVVDNAKIRP